MEEDNCICSKQRVDVVLLRPRDATIYFGRCPSTRPLRFSPLPLSSPLHKKKDSFFPTPIHLRKGPTSHVPRPCPLWSSPHYSTLHTPNLSLGLDVASQAIVGSLLMWWGVLLAGATPNRHRPFDHSRHYDNRKPGQRPLSVSSHSSTRRHPPDGPREWPMMSSGCAGGWSWFPSATASKLQATYKLFAESFLVSRPDDFKSRKPPSTPVLFTTFDCFCLLIEPFPTTRFTANLEYDCQFERTVISFTWNTDSFRGIPHHHNHS